MKAGLASQQPAQLGVVRVLMPDGSIKKFQGNRKQRRQFIKENKLVRSRVNGRNKQ